MQKKKKQKKLINEAILPPPVCPHGTPHPPFLELKVNLHPPFLELKFNLNSEVSRSSSPQTLICTPNSLPNYAQALFPRKVGAPPFASLAQSHDAFLQGKKLQTPPRPAWFSPYLVHACINEKQTGVAAGPHGGGGHQAVAMAVPKKAQEGVPDGRGLGWRGLR